MKLILKLITFITLITQEVTMKTNSKTKLNKSAYNTNIQKYLIEYCMKLDITDKKDIKCVSEHFVELCKHNYQCIYYNWLYDETKFQFMDHWSVEVIKKQQFRNLDYLTDDDYDLYCKIMKTFICKKDRTYNYTTENTYTQTDLETEMYLQKQFIEGVANVS
jgi:hypothetical protein